MPDFTARRRGQQGPRLQALDHARPRRERGDRRARRPSWTGSSPPHPDRSSSSLPGRPSPRAVPATRQPRPRASEVRMSVTSQPRAARPLGRHRASIARPRSRSHGLLFISPVDRRPGRVHGRARWSPRSSCRSPTSIRANREATTFIGLANYERMLHDPLLGQALSVTVRFALLIVPAHAGRGAGRGDARQQHAAGRPERLPDAVLHADADPASWPAPSSGSACSTPRPAGSTWSSAAFGIHGPDWINSVDWVYPSLTLMGLWGIGNDDADLPGRAAGRARPSCTTRPGSTARAAGRPSGT